MSWACCTTDLSFKENNSSEFLERKGQETDMYRWWSHDQSNYHTKIRWEIYFWRSLFVTTWKKMRCTEESSYQSTLQDSRWKRTWKKTIKHECCDSSTWNRSFRLNPVYRQDRRLITQRLHQLMHLKQLVHYLELIEKVNRWILQSI